VPNLVDRQHHPGDGDCRARGNEGVIRSAKSGAPELGRQGARYARRGSQKGIPDGRDEPSPSLRRTIADPGSPALKPPG